MSKMTYGEAIREAMSVRMRENPNVILFGEDVGAFGGCFGVSAGMLAEFGPSACAIPRFPRAPSSAPPSVLRPPAFGPLPSSCSTTF